ncbi:PLDc N-terminal domain-containing protein [Marinilabilia rubra]|uniref:Cardiolipin synthase N-terminal domain-containing protein n=1 Tax=Marinilabilia rubra TaxID=2162893 RepID=A0A2U2BCA1_9BACT|nr:PLDc N-terminal domain-containing protein [Marinilabilia rubra]PWE00690.1 hypothetical protein DDZ16_03600 [Marinilabilia rubra]
MTLLFMLSFVEIIILVAVFLIVVVLPIMAIIDIQKSHFTVKLQLTWLLLIICLPGLGAILYYLIGRRQKLKR